MGDIVLIIDSSAPQPIAVVKESYTGYAGLVGSTRVRSTFGIYDRLITRLNLLLSKAEVMKFKCQRPAYLHSGMPWRGGGGGLGSKSRGDYAGAMKLTNICMTVLFQFQKNSDVSIVSIDLINRKHVNFIFSIR